MSDDELETLSVAQSHDDILEEVSETIGRLQSHVDPEVRSQVESLLHGIDAVHRTALTHLFQAIQGLGGETFVNRLIADPAIRLLFMSYDLLAVDRRIHAEEALDAVRGHLHSHGVDVELLEVAGSEVFVRIHARDSSSLPIDAVKRDIEATLRENLIGFQILTIGDRKEAVAPAALVQLSGLRGVNRPVYHTAFPVEGLAPGSIRSVDTGADAVLVANVDGDLYAVADRCGESPLPLSFSVLDGAVLVCSWHGCRYDIRSGARLDFEGGDRIRVYPVRVVNGNIQIAIGVEEVPRSRPAQASEAGEG